MAEDAADRHFDALVRLDDIVTAPEIGIGEVVDPVGKDFVEFHLILVRDLEELVLSVCDGHLRDDRVAMGEERALAAGIDDQFQPAVIEMPAAVGLLEVQDIIGFFRAEAEVGRFLDDETRSGALFPAFDIQPIFGPDDGIGLAVDIEPAVEEDVFLVGYLLEIQNDALVPVNHRRAFNGERIVFLDVFQPAADEGIFDDVTVQGADDAALEVDEQGVGRLEVAAAASLVDGGPVACESAVWRLVYVHDRLVERQVLDIALADHFPVEGGKMLMLLRVVVLDVAVGGAEEHERIDGAYDGGVELDGHRGHEDGERPVSRAAPEIGLPARGVDITEMMDWRSSF